MIEIKELSIDLGPFQLRNINLSIAPSEYVVLLGPTGAGKTVLIECMVGLHTPKEGDILIDEESILDKYPEERNIGFVPQDYALFPNLVVEKNISYGLEAQCLAEKEINSRAEEIMNELSISHLRQRLPLNLSGGERQRVALGRALITKPRILLLDEPLSAIDENWRTELALQLRKVQQARKGTFLHVCHKFEEAADVADKIAIMQDGQIVQVGSLQEIIDQPKNFFVAQFSRTRNFIPAVARNSADGCLLKLAEGPELTCARSAKEGKVTAAIRPEDIEFVKSAEKNEKNNLTALIDKIVKKVTHTEVFCVGPCKLVVYEKSGHSSLQEGERVTLFLPPAKIRLFSEN